MNAQKRSSASRTFIFLGLVSLIVFSSVAIYFLYPFTRSEFRTVKEGGAAFVDALSDLNPNPSFEETASEYLRDAGMYVDVYKSSAVLVDFMKSFPAGYDLVIFRVHSGTSRRGVFYFTSEVYDESKYQPEQYRGELRPARDYEGNAQVFAFGAKFVDTYLQGRFQNAVVIGMGCFGAGTSHGTEEDVVVEGVPVEARLNLADAFHRQGASAVIGWDRLVSLGFSDQGSLRLVKALTVDHLTVGEAVEITNRELGPDPTYKSVLTLYPPESGNFALQIQMPQDNVRQMPDWIMVVAVAPSYPPGRMSK